MRPNQIRRAQGEIRQSQVVSTFGPGAMLDLPNHSVLITGLDSWSANRQEIFEPRLTEKISHLLQIPALRLFAPPEAEDDPTQPSSGIDCYQFPEWFITQDVEQIDADSRTRSRMLVHRLALTRGKFIDINRKRRAVVPVRFVRACSNGHIGDIDWYSFIHHGPPPDKCRYAQLWIDERGTSGDLTEIWIRCEVCKNDRSMAQATRSADHPLGYCDGSRPWLGPNTKEGCGNPNRLLIRNASNAYFPEKMTVISLPDRDGAVKQAVESVWEFLEAVEDVDDLQHECKKPKVKEALRSVSENEVLSEILQRRSGSPPVQKKVKVAELETLITAEEEIGEDRPGGDFFARTLPRTGWDVKWMAHVERVVLVHRLREVVAQVGFTRFDSATADTQGELEMGVQRAPLAREISWLPAIENRGEGIFLQFKSEAIEAWAAKPPTVQRAKRLDDGFQLWQHDHELSHRRFPDPTFIMLHSLSHMLITALSLQCGYPASSIRERVYALPGIGYGILLYTGTTDAEGTLGGLIQVGRHIHKLVRDALDQATLCSNDPVCSQHDPTNQNENRYLQGAACHGCLLIAETSCEQRNDFLDRALVVPTVDNIGAEFFPASML